MRGQSESDERSSHSKTYGVATHNMTEKPFWECLALVGKSCIILAHLFGIDEAVKFLGGEEAKSDGCLF